MRGVDGVVRHLLQICDEGLTLCQGLAAFDAFDVALVRVLERQANDDDSLRARHLHLEVCVVGDYHELRVVQPPEDGMIRPAETHHLEGEHFLAEVRRRAEADRQVNLAERLDPLSRRDAVEGRHARVDLVPPDAHELQGVREHDVEAVAPVHEHLGEPVVADDGINDERVLSRVQDVVGVVLAAEGDGLLRPVEEGRCSLVDGEDLSALALALLRGHVRCGPAANENVLHRREAVTALVVHILSSALILIAEVVEVVAEHVTFLEGVINLAPMIRTRLLQHVVDIYI